MFEKFYNASDVQIDKLIIRSSYFFDEFSNNRDKDALQKSLDQITEAIKIARQKITLMGPSAVRNNDLAYCLRKYASVLIRKQSDSTRFTEAKECLNEALTLYAKEEDNKENIILEQQRTLHQLRHLAYELKDGNLLKSTLVVFLPLLKQYQNDAYLLDCYESLSHLAFAKGDFQEALLYNDKCLNLCNKNEDHPFPELSSKLQLSYVLSHTFLSSFKTFLEKQNSEKSLIYYRQQAKIYLALLETKTDLTDKTLQKEYLTNVVEPLLWKTYDNHKHNLGQCYKNKLPKEKWKKKLLKDLVFLFSLRCKKSLLDNDETKPLDYVIKQAEIVFKHDGYYLNQIKNILKEKIEFIQKNNYLPLDYQFFKDIEPPRIIIPQEKIAVLFPQQDQTESKGVNLSYKN